MKNVLFFLSFVTFSITKAQHDTLLYVGFDSVAIDAQQNILAIPTNELDLSGWENLTWLGSEIESTIKDPASHWFENNLWKKWHKTPYIKSIDTTFAIDTTTYDTTVNIGLRSFSWFEYDDQAFTVLLSPPVWIGNNPARLKWNSMPVQGPRYQDGYKVYVLSGNNHTINTTDPTLLTPQFIMKEMDNSSSSPAESDSSLANIYKINGFTPESGVMHTMYSLPTSSESGLIDSSRQNPFMQEFEINLSAYSGNIQILFFHDSNDDHGIIIDDITITGTNNLAIKDLSRQPIISFPNPAHNTITFHIKDTSVGHQIKIYSITGELVILKQGVVNNNNNGKISVDINNLSTGIYQIEISNKSNKYFGKFSKN